MKKIKNLGQLEKEIYRLERKIQQKETQLGKNLGHFRDHFGSYLYNSFCGKKDRRKKSSLVDRLFEFEHFRSIISEIGKNISERLSEKIGRRASNHFERTKSHS